MIHPAGARPRRRRIALTSVAAGFPAKTLTAVVWEDGRMSFATVLEEAARGHLPAPDDRIEVLGEDPGLAFAVLAFPRTSMSWRRLSPSGCTGLSAPATTARRSGPSS